jgi:outer membrane protein
MPDGSRDLYIGLGVISAPEYLGAGRKRTSALPLLQAQFSNGVFISGMSAGWHLSTRENLEIGPLLALDPGRDQDGAQGAGGISEIGIVRIDQPQATLSGLHDVRSRVQAGMFVNQYLTPSLRVTTSLLAGAGNDRDGVILNLGLQHVATDLAPHHRVSFSAGVNLVNRRHNTAFFGVSEAQSEQGGLAPYAPRGGMRDVYVGAGWNWALSPSWMVVSAARLASLRGDARYSPLVERPVDFSVSTGLVYRF